MKIIIIWPLLNSLQYRENGAYMQAAQVISVSYYCGISWFKWLYLV